MRTVQLRTVQLQPGVLCEVWTGDRMQLCMVDQVVDGTLKVRRLPGEKAARASEGAAGSR